MNKDVHVGGIFYRLAVADRQCNRAMADYASKREEEGKNRKENKKTSSMKPSGFEREGRASNTYRGSSDLWTESGLDDGQLRLVLTWSGLGLGLLYNEGPMAIPLAVHVDRS